MPTETFLKLGMDKKEKIISAAKKEFSRVPFQEASIKNIVEEAGIARGSFYQYFESKEDLLSYLLKEHANSVNENLRHTLIQSNGDIFEVFISLYDYIVKENEDKEEYCFFKNIFENLKTSQDNIFFTKIKEFKPKEIIQYDDLIDKSKLNLEDEQDLDCIIRILHNVTKKAVVSSFKYQSKQEAREDYLRQIKILKRGMQK